MIKHRFQEFTFKEINGFNTKDCILNTPYSSKVLILGTFNPDTNQEDNVADFFYGRNYFWPVMFNLFQHKQTKLFKKREQDGLKPDLKSILDFCTLHELTFADLISEVLGNGNPKYETSKRNSNLVWYDRDCYDLINDDDLSRLKMNNQVKLETDAIIDYLKRTPSISAVYLTRQATGLYKTEWQKIKKPSYGRGIAFKEIFTPSGQGSKKGIKNAIFIINQWLEQFDQKWLLEKGIDKTKFS